MQFLPGTHIILGLKQWGKQETWETWSRISFTSEWSIKLWRYLTSSQPENCYSLRTPILVTLPAQTPHEDLPRSSYSLFLLNEHVLHGDRYSASDVRIDYRACTVLDALATFHAFRFADKVGNGKVDYNQFIGEILNENTRSESMKSPPDKTSSAGSSDCSLPKSHFNVSGNNATASSKTPGLLMGMWEAIYVHPALVHLCNTATWGSLVKVARIF